MIEFADIDASLGDCKVEEIDHDLLKYFTSGSRAGLNLMAAMFGGVVGQEILGSSILFFK